LLFGISDTDWEDRCGNFSTKTRQDCAKVKKKVCWELREDREEEHVWDAGKSFEGSPLVSPAVAFAGYLALKTL
jgi:hypothetical protein